MRHTAAPSARYSHLSARWPGATLVGNALALRRDGILTILSQAHRAKGDVFRLRVGRQDNLVLGHPAPAEHVLLQNAKNYVKSRSYQRLKLLLGDGLVSTEGETWRRQRALAQPFFHRPALTPMTGAMCGVIDTQLDAWEAALRAGEAVSVKEACKVLSLLLVSRCIFGVDLDEDAPALSRATEALCGFVERQRWSLLPLPTSVPTPQNVRARRDRRCIDDITHSFLFGARQREAGGLIAGLLHARSEEGRFTDAELHDQVVTLLVAGYETTAAGLCWALWLAAHNPDAAAEVREEAASSSPSLPVAERFAQESMRLYPPVWVIGRRSVEADTLGGYDVPPDAPVGIYPHLIHRHPAFWERPDAFDPSRFLPAAVEARPRFAYMPFGAGPRTCIGRHLALLEMKLCLSRVLQRFSLHAPPDARPRPIPSITLTPPDDLPLTLRPLAPH